VAKNSALLQIYSLLCNAFEVHINYLICSFPSLTAPGIDIDRPISHAPPTRILFTGMWTATRSANATIKAERGLLTELHHVPNKSHHQETDSYSLRNFGVLHSVGFGNCSLVLSSMNRAVALQKLTLLTSVEELHAIFQKSPRLVEDFLDLVCHGGGLDRMGGRCCC
jgi:hypothetical protein